MAESLKIEDYTVGWIAPLYIERAAAEAMFDEEHDVPDGFEQPRTDPNSYSWGKIGNHNIVLASTKEGFDGTTSATSSATSLLRSFPEIRFGLLVGIGGAIPRDDNDIRLGDIVVSRPSGNTGGVVQYDHVRSKPGGRERKDFLNSPPEVLLYALGKLRGRHERAPSQVSDLLREMEKRNPFMFKARSGNPGYKYPGRSKDRLFRPTYPHQGGPTCSGCVGEEEEKREPREDTDPVIHYGVIASGNTLVKDASARKELLQHIPDDCLCYEMEAAGLMNNFPCLVIRGISDYSDSHKNDHWQRYASATAAAFAKELLGFVFADGVHREKKALDMMNEKISLVQEDVADVKKALTGSQLRSNLEEIVSWLSPADTRMSHARAKEKRATGSCAWFLHGKSFRHWKNTHGSFLWLHGIVGCGKTVLSSAIIETVKAEQHKTRCIVLYFYFDFGSSQNCLEGIVKTFLWQIISAKSEIPESLWNLFESCQRNSEYPETSSLLKELHSMISATDGIKIILDALDEVKEEHRDKILSWIDEIFLTQKDRISLIVLSRYEPVFASYFQKIGSAIPMVRKDIDYDIQQYIRVRMQQIRDSKQWNLPSYEIHRMESELVQKANGMFRLAAVQIDSLQGCQTPRELQQALQSLPASLTEMYDTIISQIRPERRKTAMRLLQILAYAERPLLLAEIADAIVVNLHESPGFRPDQRMFNAKNLPGYCPSLVILEEPNDTKSSTMTQRRQVIYDNHEREHRSLRGFNEWERRSFVIPEEPDDTEYDLISSSSTTTQQRQVIYDNHEREHRSLRGFNEWERRWLPCSRLKAFTDIHTTSTWEDTSTDVVRLAHFSVNEYLRSHDMRADIREDFEEPRVHSIFVDLSLQYLSSPCIIESDLPVLMIRKDYPFAHYAARFWTRHLKACKQGSATLDLVVSFLTNPQAFKTWMLMFEPENCYIYRSLSSGTHKMRLSDSDIEIPSPLQVATAFAFDEVVKKLLSSGASLPRFHTWSNSDKYDHAFFQAFYHKSHPYHLAKACRDSVLRTSPLYIAAQRGLEDTTNLLLEKGLSLHDHAGPQGSPLTAACSAGHERLVARLIAADTDPKTDCSQYDSAVMYSFIHRHWKVLQHLINAGARFPPSSFKPPKDLERRFRSKARKALECLILENVSWREFTSDVNVIKGGVHAIPTLERVMEISTPFVMQTSELQRLDALMRCPYMELSPELHSAVKRGDMAFINTALPGSKSKFWNRDDKGKSPLHHAAEIGRVDIIDILVSTGFSLGDTDSAGNTPLAYALMNDHLHTLDLLSSSEGSIQEERTRLRKQLKILVAIDSEDLQRLEELFGAGAHVSVVKEDAKTKSALRHAVVHHSVLIIDFILSDQLDPLVQDVNGETPYRYALQNGCFDFVQMFPFDDSFLFGFFELYRRLPSEYAEANGYHEMKAWLVDQEQGFEVPSYSGREAWNSPQGTLDSFLG